MTIQAGRPVKGEFAPYYEGYIGKVSGEDPLAALESQTPDVETYWRGITAEQARHRYAADKWSVQEVIGHISDAERVFAFRALWFARGAASELPGFDENAWMPVAGFDALPLSQIIDGWRAQREATLALLRSLEPDAWTRRGTANGKVMSVRALAYTIAGHELHHIGVLRERYGIAGLAEL